MDPSEKLLRRMGLDQHLPVPIISLARALGAHVFDADITHDGELEICKGIPVIRVRSSACGPRKRFVVAHEIAHLELGHTFTGIHQDTDVYAYAPVERQATAFAAELLVPRQQFLSLLPFAKTIDSLASLFGVSTFVIWYRLGDLGCEGYLRYFMDKK